MSSDYFESYADLETHRIMLSDQRRVKAYTDAIFKNRGAFKGKTVMDVGAGVGFLSVMCHMAGAAKVYAVEAAPGMAQVIRATLVDNEITEGVIVIEGEVEKVELNEKVDIIISEWMGFYLLHEGMLSSVLNARDRFLKKGGTLIPDCCELLVSLCRLSTFHGKWNCFGAEMGEIGQQYRELVYQNEPQIITLKPKHLVSETKTVFRFNLYEINDSDLEEILKQFSVKILSDTEIQGVGFWFNVTLKGKVFSTSPHFFPTHWKQTVLVFQDQVPVKKGDILNFKLNFKRLFKRKYCITFEAL